MEGTKIIPSGSLLVLLGERPDPMKEIRDDVIAARMKGRLDGFIDRDRQAQLKKEPKGDRAVFADGSVYIVTPKGWRKIRDKNAREQP